MARPKDLHTLIRMRKWDVDEKQRALAVLLRREEAILAAQDDLAAAIAQEKVFVGQAQVIETTFTFSAFLGRCHVRREELTQALMEVRRLIDDARDELAESYRRLKTFEVTQEQRDAAEAKENERRENLALDEIGLTLYRRAAR
jgi:flagellar export protein FliJ